MNRFFMRTALAALCTSALLLAVPSASAQVTLTSAVAWPAATTQPGGTAIVAPEAVYADTHGNIFVAAGITTSAVWEIPANGGPAFMVATNLTSVRGVAADSQGNIYIAQSGSSFFIQKIPAGGGTPTNFGSAGLSRAFLMTVDMNDNLYVANGGNGVAKFAPDGTMTSEPFSGITANNPHGVAVDSHGNIVVTTVTCTVTSQCIFQLTPGGVQTALPITGIAAPYGIVFDSADNLYVIDNSAGRLLEYQAPITAATVPITLASGLGASTVGSVALSPRGDILYNNTNANRIYALQAGSVVGNGNGTVNYYGTPTTLASGVMALTFTSVTAKTFGAPIFLSNNSATAQLSANTASTCTTGKSVTAGGTCLLNLVLTPQQAGPISGQVVLTESGTGAHLASVSVTGVGDAPVAAFAPGIQSNFASSLSMPQGVTLDAGGNVYVADAQHGTVSKISSAGVAATLAFSGLTRPVGVAVDGTGAVYVSDSTNNAVYKLTTANAQSTITTSGLNAPMGIALDGLNNLYIADNGNRRVVRIDGTSGSQTIVPFTGLAGPSWVTADPAGDVFVSDTGKLYECVYPYSASGCFAQKTITASGLSAASGFAVDSNGSFYIADSGNNNIFVLPATGTAFTLGSGVSSPAGLALAANGNLYVASANAGQVVLLDRTKQSLTFPATASGATSAPMTAVVQNAGNATLNYSAISFPAHFAQQTPLAATDCSSTSTLAPAAICNMSVIFAPTAAVSYSEALTQTDNATPATQTINLLGDGIQATSTVLALTTPATGNPMYGQTPTVTVTIAPTSGSGTPTGSVTFALDGGANSAPVTLVSGQATYSPVALSAGQHTVTAVYSGDNTFATSTSSVFNMTVTPAVLTVTAVSQTRMYNVANAPLTYNITGFSYSDTNAVVSGAPVLSTTATTTSVPNTYPISITAGTLAAANYTFNPVAGSITVTKASNTITFPAIANVTYGAFPIVLTGTASSGLPITYSVVSGKVTVTSGAGAAATITGTGPVTIAADQPGDSNYNAATRMTQSFTIAPAVLTVTADNLSKQTGQANPTLTYTLKGFAYSDTATSAVSGTPSLSTTAMTNSPSATYPITITAGSLTAANYAFTFVNGTLTVTGSTPQTITFAALPNATYGTAAIPLSASASSGNAITYTVSGPAILNASNSLTITGVGSVSVTAAQFGDSTYAAATSVTRTFIVNQAVLAVTTASTSRYINTANPTFTYTVTGFVNNDPSTVVSGAPAITTTATTSSPVGTYPITTTIGSLTAVNYTFTFNTATLTVNPAPQTITFAALPNVTYGATPIALSAAASSSLAVTYTVTGPATLNGTSLIITGSGSVAVTASQAGDATYAAATPVIQSFTVTKAPLTVTASDVSIVYGSPIPTTFSYSVTGFVNSDPQSVVTGTPAITTTATSTSPGGSYPVTPAIGSLAAANYSFTNFVPGTLTISAVTQTIKFTQLPTEPQSAATSINPMTLTATASSGLAVVYTVVSGPATVTGNQLVFTGAGNVTITASQPGNSSYLAAAPVTQTFLVTATTTTKLTLSTNNANVGTSVTLTATVASSLAGTLTGTVTFYIGTVQFGTPVAVTGGTASMVASSTSNPLPSGSLSLTAVYSGDAVYSASTSGPAAILVITQDFNVSTTNSNLTIPIGQTGSTTITVAPVGGYSMTIAFSCGSLPVNLECTFAPPAMNFYPGTGTSSLAQTTTLTFTAVEQSSRGIGPLLWNESKGRISYAGLYLAFPGLALLFFCVGRRRKNLRRSIYLAVLLLAVTAGLTGLGGCGSKASIYPAAGTYNIPVIMDDGTGITHVLTITVTLQ